RAYCLKTQPATGETYPKSDLFNKARERIKKKIYGTREEARSDIFGYIEMFYNSKRRHGSSNQMSPTEYENQYYQ
ncbi:IS3 family transposase, partial [Klebsiella pneumoniae]